METKLKQKLEPNMTLVAAVGHNAEWWIEELAEATVRSYILDNIQDPKAQSFAYLEIGHHWDAEIWRPIQPKKAGGKKDGT